MLLSSKINYYGQKEDVNNEYKKRPKKKQENPFFYNVAFEIIINYWV